MERYTYVSTISAGAYGVVYQCVDSETGRYVAAKGIRLAHQDDEVQQQQQQQQHLAEEAADSASSSSSSPTSTAAASSSPSGSGGGGGGGDWRSLYVMPAPADRFVVQFRRWLDETGGSRPWALPDVGHCTTGAATAATAAASAAAAAASLSAAAAAYGSAAGSDPLPRERVLDRYHSHVRSCSACSGALANLQRLAAVARLIGLVAVAAAAGVAAAAAAAATTAPLAATAVLASQPPAATLMAAAVAVAAAAVVCWLVALWSEGMVRRFHYTEEGRELRMDKDRWLRRLLFSGTNSFNSMVALTNKPTNQQAKAAT